MQFETTKPLVRTDKNGIMNKPVYFEEYKSPAYWAQRRKGHPVRDRLLALAALALAIGGDMLTSMICGG